MLMIDAESTIDETNKTINKLIKQGFPKTAQLLLDENAKLLAKSKPLSIYSLKEFYKFVTKNKSKIMIDEITTIGPIIIASWITVKNTFIEITFNEDKTVDFEIIAYGASDIGIAPRINGYIQNVVLINNLDNLMKSTKYIKNNPINS